MKRNHIKTYIILIIFISIIGISIAYASLNQQLQIKTSTTVQSSQTSWNIVISKDSCYTKGHAILGTVEITGTTFTLSNFKFQAPGDNFACVFIIENKGEIDAKISSANVTWPTASGINTTSDQKLINENLWRVFKWDSPTADVKIGDTIPSGSEKKILIQYGINSTMPTLPTNPVPFSAVATINFEQA